MVHIGLDSVKLNGVGLQALVKVGQKVRVGDPLVKYQPKMFETQGIDDTVVTFLLNSNEYSSVTLNENDPKATLTAEK